MEALGWAVWNFLYLEEKIIRWLWLLQPATSLSEWRSNTAFGKGVELGRAAKAAALPADLYEDIQNWLRRYEQMVADARNGIMHAHAYTVSHGPEGWVPGLNYTDQDGHGHRIAESPEDLHVVAAKVEGLMLELSGMEPRLQASLGAADEEEAPG